MKTELDHEGNEGDVYKKSFAILIIFMVSISSFLGCTSSKGQPVNNEIEEKQTDHSVVVIDSQSDRRNDEGVPSPISGIYTDALNINRRPFAVMLDNQSKARPQAGLDQAEIVYEILAEGMITRYLAIFLINEPSLIGPVRSARPYFLDKAMEFNALYVHVGGSPQAISDIKTLKIDDIDAMSRDSSIFWRKKHKSAPHNTYTDTKAIRKAAASSRYDEKVNFEPLDFNQEAMKINGEKMIYIEIPYFKDYKPSFKYNEVEKTYYRYLNNKPHLDEVSQMHLSAANIIIQEAETKVIDSEGRLEIELVGQGKGLFITNGEKRPIVWEKNDRKSRTRYFYEDGTEIKLNPGVTWVQIIPKNLELRTE